MHLGANVSNIAFEIFVIFLLLVANGIFAMSEIAVVTARKSRLQELAKQEMARARAALELANAPNTFLSTVQIGITLVGILAGAFGGGALREWIAVQLSSIPLVAPYSRSLALGIVVLGITYFSVIIGEPWGIPNRSPCLWRRPCVYCLRFAVRSFICSAPPPTWCLGYSARASTNDHR
jgi:CBS domain containing-hemolysin-like protein